MNKFTKRLQKSSKKRKMKNTLLVEIADDIMDVIHNAKLYKKINKKRK